MLSMHLACYFVCVASAKVCQAIYHSSAHATDASWKQYELVYCEHQDWQLAAHNMGTVQGFDTFI